MGSFHPPSPCMFMLGLVVFVGMTAASQLFYDRFIFLLQFIVCLAPRLVSSFLSVCSNGGIGERHDRLGTVGGEEVMEARG